ncbi:MAG: serine hydrolase [Ignavibacteria bacterium]|nr:serine hydrolase [Ignavibacteria bacterium]
MKNIVLFFIMMCFGIVTVQSQDKFAELRTELSSVIAPFQGTVGIAMIDLQNNDTLTVHNSIHFPMMSVYKLPQAIAVLHEIDKGTLSLHEKYVSQKICWTILHGVLLKNNIPAILSNSR